MILKEPEGVIKTTRKYVLRIMLIGLILLLLKYSYEAIDYVKKYHEQTEYLDDYYDLNTIPEGRVIWVMGFGKRDTSRLAIPRFQYNMYQVAIYNFQENKIYKINVPVYVALYLYNTGFSVKNPYQKMETESKNIFEDAKKHIEPDTSVLYLQPKNNK